MSDVGSPKALFLITLIINQLNEMLQDIPTTETLPGLPTDELILEITKSYRSDPSSIEYVVIFQVFSEPITQEDIGVFESLKIDSIIGGYLFITNDDHKGSDLKIPDWISVYKTQDVASVEENLKISMNSIPLGVGKIIVCDIDYLIR